mgnify:CR=1 FL=1
MAERVMTLNDLSAINYHIDLNFDLSFGSPHQMENKESSTSDSSVIFFPSVFLSKEGNISKIPTLTVEEIREYEAIKHKYIMAISQLENFEGE